MRFDASQRFAAKLEAIAAHLSQTTDLIGDDAAGFRLTPAMIDILARPVEILLESPGA